MSPVIASRLSSRAGPPPPSPPRRGLPRWRRAESNSAPRVENGVAFACAAPGCFLWARKWLLLRRSEYSAWVGFDGLREPEAPLLRDLMIRGQGEIGDSRVPGNPACTLVRGARTGSGRWERSRAGLVKCGRNETADQVSVRLTRPRVADDLSSVPNPSPPSTATSAAAAIDAPRPGRSDGREAARGRPSARAATLPGRLVPARTPPLADGAGRSSAVLPLPGLPLQGSCPLANGSGRSEAGGGGQAMVDDGALGELGASAGQVTRRGSVPSVPSGPAATRGV